MHKHTSAFEGHIDPVLKFNKQRFLHNPKGKSPKGSNLVILDAIQLGPVSSIYLLGNCVLR